ncbi:hypothetical protein J2Y65_001591 [Aeromonas salmonicida]|nr:hypothetical protein [Aeromonas salmonicida]
MPPSVQLILISNPLPAAELQNNQCLYPTFRT